MCVEVKEKTLMGLLLVLYKELLYTREITDLSSYLTVFVGTEDRDNKNPKKRKHWIRLNSRWNLRKDLVPTHIHLYCL